MCPKLPKHFAFSKYFVQVGRDCNSVYVEEKNRNHELFWKVHGGQICKNIFSFVFILFIFCPTHDKSKSKSFLGQLNSLL